MNELIAVNVGHSDISHQHIGLPLVHQLKRFLCTVGRSDLCLSLGQYRRDDLARTGLVVDN
jgi:hypothetical protein